MEEYSMKRLHTIAATTLILLAGQLAAASAQEPIGILLAAGDIACPRAKATGDIIVAEIEKAKAKAIPVGVMALGDIAYDEGLKDDFPCFDEHWEKRFSNVLFPVPGNHEYRGNSSDPYYFKYFKDKKNRWVLQQETEKGEKGEKLGYFSLNFPDEQKGPWRLIGLNSELPDSAMREQVEWLTGDLQKKLEGDQKPPCILAFWHKPVLTSGSHGHGDCEACIKPDAPLCRPSVDRPVCEDTRTILSAYRALFEHRASVVLAGHDHDYEQFARHDPNGKPHEQGLRSFVVGTGGRRLYQTPYTERWEEAPQGPREVYNDQMYGVLRLELYPDRYRWSFISTTGAPLPLTRADGVTVDNDTCTQRP
jgi:hypothetical protein